jgi:uncharacterized phage protein (TIGR02220 family)
MKRFTETTKWDNPWFRRLESSLKIFWMFICDRCDHAGFWRVDFELAEFLTGHTYDPRVILKAFEDRILPVSQTHWQVVPFIPFQYGNLNPANRCHASVIRGLQGQGRTLDGPYKGLNTRTEGDKDKVQVQDKDKDKVPGESEGSQEDCSWERRDSSLEVTGMYHRDTRRVLMFLGEVTGKAMSELSGNMDPIDAMLRQPDVTLEGIRAMIKRQGAMWKGTKQWENMRPQTLFKPDLFPSYYDSRTQPILRVNGASGRVDKSILEKELDGILKNYKP